MKHMCRNHQLYYENAKTIINHIQHSLIERGINVTVVLDEVNKAKLSANPPAQTMMDNHAECVGKYAPLQGHAEHVGDNAPLESEDHTDNHLEEVNVPVSDEIQNIQIGASNPPLPIDVNIQHIDIWPGIYAIINCDLMNGSCDINLNLNEMISTEQP